MYTVKYTPHIDFPPSPFSGLFEDTCNGPREYVADRDVCAQRRDQDGQDGEQCPQPTRENEAEGHLCKDILLQSKDASHEQADDTACDDGAQDDG